MIRWLLALALLSGVAWFAIWLQRRQEEKPLAAMKRDSFLKHQVPMYHQTQEGAHRKQHRPVLRYPRRSA